MEKIIAESTASFRPAFCRHRTRGLLPRSERSRFAARLLHDLFRYNRDLRVWKRSAPVLTASISSATKSPRAFPVNGMLYEFLPPEDQQPEEERVLSPRDPEGRRARFYAPHPHADGKGPNAASYFSLNFDDPVNKFLAKYGAKSFLEGDAIIVAILERDGEAMLSVGRTASWHGRL